MGGGTARGGTRVQNRRIDCINGGRGLIGMRREQDGPMGREFL